MGNIDPITFAVVRNNLIYVARGMQEVAYRCAVTTMMYEIMDCCFGILDADTGVIAQSHGLVSFLGSLGPGTKNCLDIIGKENINPGDVILSTVPIITGSHSSDALIFTPIFHKGEIFCFAATKTHWQDVGAKSAFPIDSQSVYEEGILIPPTKIYKEGEFQENVWNIIKWNSRAPNMIWGDMQAQLAGCRFAEGRIAELLKKYGAGTITSCIKEMYDYNERMARLTIEKIPDGTWTAEDYMDDNCIDQDKPLLTKVTVTVKGSNITIDYTGSAPEQKGPVNGLLVGTISMTGATVKALTTPDLPANEGCFRPIKVIAPEGSIYNAGPTAPVALGFWVPNTCIELINKALHQVLPEKIPACSGGDVCGQVLIGIHPITGDYWGALVPNVIGQGGDYFADGENYLFHHSGASPKNAPVEVLEVLYPLFIDEVGFLQDSGGPGRHRGGLATRLNYHVLAPAAFSSFTERGKLPRWGIDSGKEGKRNHMQIKSKKYGDILALKCSGFELDAGDRIISTAGGGCGYGDPFTREPEAVLEDVLDSYISIESAKLDYGVVINPNSLDIDINATEKIRSKACMKEINNI